MRLRELMKKIASMSLVCASLFSSGFSSIGEYDEIITFGREGWKVKAESMLDHIDLFYYQISIDATSWKVDRNIWFVFHDADGFELEKIPMATVYAGSNVVHRGKFTIYKSTWENGDKIFLWTDL